MLARGEFHKNVLFLHPSAVNAGAWCMIRVINSSLQIMLWSDDRLLRLINLRTAGLDCINALDDAICNSRCQIVNLDQGTMSSKKSWDPERVRICEQACYLGSYMYV